VVPALASSKLEPNEYPLCAGFDSSQAALQLAHASPECNGVPPDSLKFSPGLSSTRKQSANAAGVDSSEAALQLARANAERNGVAARCEFVKADVAEFMRGAAPQAWDIVVLDPPKLAPNRKVPLPYPTLPYPTPQACDIVVLDDPPKLAPNRKVPPASFFFVRRDQDLQHGSAVERAVGRAVAGISRAHGAGTSWCFIRPSWRSGVRRPHLLHAFTGEFRMTVEKQDAMHAIACITILVEVAEADLPGAFTANVHILAHNTAFIVRNPPNRKVPLLRDAMLSAWAQS